MSNRRPPSIQSIMSVLPQSQCQQCGYGGCWPYARAIVRGETRLDLCAPGGATTQRQLAWLCGLPEAAAGTPPADTPPALAVVAIDANECIGCGRCLPVCPVDAIAGAVGFLHGVLLQSCTGCRLCLASCPADCFTPAPDTPPVPARLARYRYTRKRRRLLRATRPESRRIAVERKRHEIADALARVQGRRGWPHSATELARKHSRP
ncbi:MAG: RnfABCDGE type electron transport complex subunit B [Gammaproteobacteria bacterium]|nr:RnfABCDGE type electron transport complex subunit B [Gammaproteobacteria bacterium]